MNVRFDGQVAILTGAGSGLGRCYALELSSRGAKVVVNDLAVLPDGESRAQKTVEAIRLRGGEAVANCDNVADPKSADRIAAAAMDHFGQVDILINNAGIIRDKSFLKMPMDDFEEVIRVHLLGSAYLTKAVFPIMRDANYGRILLTTSTAGLFGNFGQTNYSAAKLGLVGFMNALKLEGAKYNIKVNTISPVAATGLAQGTFPEAISERIKPEWVASMALYLVSDQCNATGMILSAGGGYYSNVHIVEGQGIRFASDSMATPEGIAERFSDIIDMKDARHYDSATDNMLDVLAPLMNNQSSH